MSGFVLGFGFLHCSVRSRVRAGPVFGLCRCLVRSCVRFNQLAGFRAVFRSVRRVRFGSVFDFVLCSVLDGVQFCRVFAFHALFGLVRYPVWSGVRFGLVFGLLLGSIRYGVRLGPVLGLVRTYIGLAFSPAARNYYQPPRRDYLPKTKGYYMIYYYGGP